MKTYRYAAIVRKVEPLVVLDVSWLVWNPHRSNKLYRFMIETYRKPMITYRKPMKTYRKPIVGLKTIHS